MRSIRPYLKNVPFEIALEPERRSSSRASEIEIESACAALESKLLQWRLTNITRTSAHDDAERFTPAVRNLMRSIAGPILDVAELKGRIISLLAGTDEEIRVDNTLRLESIVLETLMVCCHEMRSMSMSVTNICQMVNTALHLRGEQFQITQETVGRKLRGLGFRTSFINRGLKGLSLVRDTRRRIHQLSEQWRTRSWGHRKRNNDCQYCAESVPEVNPKGSSN